MANLREAFEYASKNPNSEFANNLKQLAASGSLNMEAKKYGLDLSPFQQQVEPKKKEGVLSMQPVKDVITQTANENNRLSQEYKPVAAGVQQALNTGAGAINALAELPGVRAITRPVGQAFSTGIEKLSDMGGEAILKGAQKIDSITGLSEATTALGNPNENLDQILSDAQKATTNLATIAGTAAGIQKAPTAVRKLGAATGADIAFDNIADAKNYVKRYSQERAIKSGISKRMSILEKIDSAYSGMRKLDEKSRRFNQEPRRLAAESDYLQGSVDENGVIRTTQEGGSVERMRAERITPVEKTVRQELMKENKFVGQDEVKFALESELKKAGVEGAELKSALDSIQSDLDGLTIRAIDMGAPAGTVPVVLLHDAKIAKSGAIDYTNPSSAKVGKARVKALKELVENNADFDVRDVNKELSKQYSLEEYLRALDGKRVEGGRLGKYAAKGTGALIGGGLGALFGPAGAAAGAYIGAEAGSSIKGKMMKKTFGTDKGLPYRQKVSVKNKIIDESVSNREALKNMEEYMKQVDQQRARNGMISEEYTREQNNNELFDTITEDLDQSRTYLSILKDQLSEMTPEKMLYERAKKMKEGQFSDSNFISKGKNKKVVSDRNKLNEAIAEQGRGGENWDGSADFANESVQRYADIKERYDNQKRFVKDLTVRVDKILKDNNIKRSKVNSLPGFVSIGGEIKDVSRMVDRSNPYSGVAALLDNADRKPMYKLADAIAKKELITKQMVQEADSVIEKINKAAGKQLINPNGTDLSKLKQITLLREADDALTKSAISQYDKSQAKLGTQKKDIVEADLVSEAKKYKSAEEFVKAQATPKTAKVWIKSKFSGGGGYADIPISRKEDNITLYQGGIEGDKRQFWTPNKEYAEQFGSVKEKTGTFYKIDNGNRVTDVYIEAPTKSQLVEIWEKANKK